MSRLYRVQEFAELAGVTVGALGKTGGRFYVWQNGTCDHIPPERMNDETIKEDYGRIRTMRVVLVGENCPMIHSFRGEVHDVPRQTSGFQKDGWSAP